jgi:class 3 adenylate cyclase
MPELPDGTLTVMHTDIENSTPLTLRLGDRYPAVLAAHRALLRTACAAHDGSEVDTQGDSFFVVFRRATQAVGAAAAIQRALAAEGWPAGGAVRVRIGLHTGEPIRTPEGYTGLDVVRGERIKAAGYGGQVLLSAATATLVQDALVDELALRDLGAHRLKGLPRPERIYQLVIPGLPADFPALRSLDAPAGPLPGRGPARVLTTVLFVDLVGATERLVALGDRRWRDLQARCRASIRGELVRHGGQEVDTVADAVFSVFEGAAAAIRCGCAIQEALAALGLTARVGVHAGEVEREAQELFGLTIHVGARIVALAGPGEVLVSGTVKDLVAGSGIPFTDRGTHTLRNVPGEWRLFAARCERVPFPPQSGP